MKAVVTAAVLFILTATSASAQSLGAQRRPVVRLHPMDNYQHHLTLFTGVSSTSTVFPMMGAAFGGGFAGSGYELEIAHSRRARVDAPRSFGTFSAGFFLNLPLTVHGADVYVIGGIGLWSETFGKGRGAGGLAQNAGAGAKYQFAGPLRLRAEYRFFLLRGSIDGSASRPVSHRLTIGLCAFC